MCYYAQLGVCEWGVVFILTHRCWMTGLDEHLGLHDYTVNNSNNLYFQFWRLAKVFLEI